MKQSFILPPGSTITVTTTVTDSRGNKSQTQQTIAKPGTHYLPPIALANVRRATPI